MRLLRMLAAIAIVLSLSALATAQRGAANALTQARPERAGVSVFRGRVEAIERPDTAAFWQLAVRVAPAGRTSGLVFVGVAAGRSVVRGRGGRSDALPGVRVGDSVTAWVHGVVLMSDPGIAFAESVRVAR